MPFQRRILLLVVSSLFSFLFVLPSFAQKKEALCQKYAISIVELKRAASDGDAHSQLCLGEIYLNDEGSYRDYKEAFKWFFWPRVTAMRMLSISWVF